MNYDLVIAYRVYPGIAKSPVFYSNDKLKLAELGLRSLRLALGQTIRVRMIALLDGCPPEYETMVLRYFPREHTEIMHLNRIGNHGTFLLQINRLLEQNHADFVYFAEDDYLYRPGTFEHLLNFAASAPDVHFVTPCDHPDYFRLPLHERCSVVRYCSDHFWRTAGSTCLTFLTRRSVLQKTASVFRTYQHGNFDASMWLSLTKFGVRNPLHMLRSGFHSRLEAAILAKAWLFGWHRILAGRRYNLWVPMPSMATQIECDTLAPGVNWHSVAAEVEQAFSVH